MFNIDYAHTDSDFQHNWTSRYSALAEMLSCWFILNSLKPQYPLVDTTLAKIYFRTYEIPVGNAKEDLQEAMQEYEPDILRFFLCCQRQRCLDIVDRIANHATAQSMILPVQCKQFISEMLNLNSSMGTHNAFTKETEVLDSLRDTIIGNSIGNKYHSYAGGCKDGGSSNTITGQYILNSYEITAYLNILRHAVEDLYAPLFGIRGSQYNRPLYALTETYEDSATRLSKVIDYLKTGLFMVCTSIDSKISFAYPTWMSPSSAVPSIQDDMFAIIDHMITSGGPGRCDVNVITDKIRREVSQYGGLSVTHAICLPHGNHVSLDVDNLKKNANSLTFKFLYCQEFLSMIPACQSHAVASPEGPIYA